MNPQPFALTRRQSLTLAAGVAAAAVGGPLTQTADASPVVPQAPRTGAQRIALKRWSSTSDFMTGTTSGITMTTTALVQKNGGGAYLRNYTDPFNNKTRTYQAGRWTSPVVPSAFPGSQAIVSWNAHTSASTWIEVEFRARLASGAWTKFYVMGRWNSGRNYTTDIHRTSVKGQDDANAQIQTDTFAARAGKEFTAYQVRVTLLRPNGSSKSAAVHNLSVMTNEPLGAYTGPLSTPWYAAGFELAVPRYSQNIHKGEYPAYGGGGEVWCSPTSVAMVMAYWGHSPTAAQLSGIVAPKGDPQVDFAALHCWDYAYSGSGNWPFNPAYAHIFGLDGFVTRLRSLNEAERFIRTRIPLVISASWAQSEMPEAGYGTNGHLMVLIGFTAAGDPILNDPNKSTNAGVRVVYKRANLERVWQNSSKGLVYVMQPGGRNLPARVGPTANW